ncbi:hypothetical protein KCP70_08345 [Salmonella enterica subsp. enterica]|nr:hypothetical protein KCP70_08345 [Salmonella enterica subsp. enterica]
MLPRGQNLLGAATTRRRRGGALRRTRGEKRHGRVPRLRRHERLRNMKAALQAVRSAHGIRRGARSPTPPARPANWLDLTRLTAGNRRLIPSRPGYVRHSHADGRF